MAWAAFSGIGHALFSNTPVVGASGAVAAVTGAYLVLFPNTVITVAYVFFYIWDTLELKAIYFIAFKLILWDNYLQPMLSPQAIAYGAHLAGYTFGIVCILILLAVRLVDAGHDSLWAILRRRVFAGANPRSNTQNHISDVLTTPDQPIYPRFPGSVNR
jgi:membrane associated rhomboid family serine protease